MFKKKTGKKTKKKLSALSILAFVVYGAMVLFTRLDETDD